VGLSAVVDRLVYGVTLTAEECAGREAFARGRWEETRRQGLPDQAYGASTVEDSIALDIVGAFGEYAVWRWLGRPGGQATVDRVNTFHVIPDVGQVEVRAASGHDRNLIIRERDPQERPYLLTTWELPEVWIHGWVYGWEARTRGQRWNPNGRHEAWLIRQRDLRPLPIKPLRAGMRIVTRARSFSAGQGVP
jgi:hypothetical protein